MSERHGKIYGKSGRLSAFRERRPPLRITTSHQLNRIEHKLDNLAQLSTQGQKLDALLALGAQIMAAIDDLKAKLDDVDAKVALQTTVEASAMTLLTELKAAVDGIATAPDLASAIAQAQAISDHIAANDQALADSVAANTPAAPAPVATP